jgi:putative transposase
LSHLQRIVQSRGIMPRSRRLQIPGTPHHVIQRGVNRVDIFRSEADYECFLTILRAAAIKHQTDVHTHVLMTNHVHLIVTPLVENGLAATMKNVGETFVRYFNRRYERTGGLFDGRYRSLAIDSERYWFTCMRYVELNPVRAGIVERPEDYRWSSYRFHALGERNDLIVPHGLYLALGNSPSVRQQCWRAICREALCGEQLAEMRDLVRHGRTVRRAEPTT